MSHKKGQRKRVKELKEGYRANADVSREIAKAAMPLQSKAIQAAEEERNDR